LGGDDLLALAPHQIARRGVARTFQNTEVFRQLTALDNVLIGRHTHLRAGVIRGALWLPGVGREEAQAREAAHALLARRRPRAVTGVEAGSLPLGAQKRLEIARARLGAAAAPARRAGRRTQSDGDADLDGRDPAAPGREQADDCPGRARHGARHGHLGPRGRARPRPQDRRGPARRDRARRRRRRGVPRQRGRGRVSAVLELDDVSVTYGKRRALEGVSLTVAPGEIVTLLGANGAGKSTTLRTVSGLIRPSHGRVRYEGRDITHAPSDAIV